VNSYSLGMGNVPELWLQSVGISYYPSILDASYVPVVIEALATIRSNCLCAKNKKFSLIK